MRVGIDREKGGSSGGADGAAKALTLMAGGVAREETERLAREVRVERV
jgi:hypothetical protein